jgi:beta-mannanase
MRASAHRLGTAACVAVVAACVLLQSSLPSEAATARKVYLGAAVPGAPWSMTDLDRFEADAGHRATFVAYYTGWRDEFNRYAFDNIAARGSIPLVTWEPWDYTNGTTNQPSYRLSAIAGGAWDAYITRWAQGARAWGKTIWLRFAHEMNGDWYPWAEGVNGNVAGDYVKAWRRVRGIFRSVGANNIGWVWSPNVVAPNTTPLTRLYPGDADVDYIGIDGYNGGTALPWGGWKTFDQLFGETLRQVRALTKRRIMLSEVASAEAGGSKAAWINDFFNALDNNPDIFSFVWFNWNKETDWRIQSSDAARRAFATGVAPRAI